MIHQTGSPLGRDQVMNGKKLNSETDLYFGDTSSNYTVSAHNDGSNSSAMYEEIHGHRYDKIQRPLTKVTSIRSGVPAKPCQRASWDGQNVAQHQPSRTGSSITASAHPVITSAGQARSSHSADTASNKEKMFSPIVVPKYIQQSNNNNWAGSSQQQLTDPADTCSFVPYRRAAVVPASGSFNEAGEVYENVTNLDFEEDSRNKQPRTLSPDEEVAILTSQFHGAPPVDESTHENPVSEEDDDDDDSIEETMRAVNV